MFKIGIIYKATSPSGKVYIGQTICALKRRKYLHFRAANSKGKKYNTRFSKALRKYGNLMLWEILHENIIETELDLLEEKEIAIHDSYMNGYNSTPGGGVKGAFRGKKHNDGTKKLLSEAKQGSLNPMYGFCGDKNPFYRKKHTEETKMKMSENHCDSSGDNNSMFGKKHTEETKMKMRDAHLDNPRNISGDKNPFYGKKHTEETKMKMRESHLRRKK